MMFARREREPGTTRLKGLAQGIMTTRPDEIGCLWLFEQVDHFAEMQLSGMEAAEGFYYFMYVFWDWYKNEEEFLALLTVLEMKPVA